MTISRTARVWVNENRNIQTTEQTERYFKNIFTEEEYVEFYEELTEQTKECVKLEFESQGIYPKPKTMNEIYVWMDKNINYFNNIDIIIESVYTEIFQSVSGFFGTGCTDKQFEEVREAMGSFIWKKLTEVYDYMVVEENPKVSDWMEYVKDIECQCSFGCLPAIKAEQKNVNETKVKVCVENKCNYHPTNKVFTILNTAKYFDNENVVTSTIVECGSALELKAYGFDTNDVDNIEIMPIGGCYTNTDYGKSVIVVRMA